MHVKLFLVLYNHCMYSDFITTGKYLVVFLYDNIVRFKYVHRGINLKTIKRYSKIIKDVPTVPRKSILRRYTRLLAGRRVRVVISAKRRPRHSQTARTTYVHHLQLLYINSKSF